MKSRNWAFLSPFKVLERASNLLSVGMGTGPIHPPNFGYRSISA